MAKEAQEQVEKEECLNNGAGSIEYPYLGSLKRKSHTRSKCKS